MTPAHLRRMARSAGHAAVVIKPDIGIREKPGPAHTTYAYIASKCDRCDLVLVFDQSFSRGQQRPEAMKTKLTALRAIGVRGVYYNSHAPFLLCGRSSARVMRFQKALVQAGLPAERFVGIPASP